MTPSHPTGQLQQPGPDQEISHAEDMDEAPDAWHGHLSRFLAPHLSCLTSGLVHTGFLLVLALLVLPEQRPPDVTDIDMFPTEEVDDLSMTCPSQSTSISSQTTCARQA